MGPCMEIRMPGKDTKQHQPLPWPRREILVRDLLAQVCEIHRHQLALKELREIREARGSKVARELSSALLKSRFDQPGSAVIAMARMASPSQAAAIRMNATASSV